MYPTPVYFFSSDSLLFFTGDHTTSGCCIRPPPPLQLISSPILCMQNFSGHFYYSQHSFVYIRGTSQITHFSCLDCKPLTLISCLCPLNISALALLLVCHVIIVADLLWPKSVFFFLFLLEFDYCDYLCFTVTDQCCSVQELGVKSRIIMIL